MMLLKNRCSTIGVTITPELETVIKGAITGAVESLPKTHDENGNVVEVYAEYDPESRGGNPADGRKIKSTIHWVDAATAIDAEVRLYDNLFTDADPDLSLIHISEPTRP